MIIFSGRGRRVRLVKDGPAGDCPMALCGDIDFVFAVQKKRGWVVVVRFFGHVQTFNTMDGSPKANSFCLRFAGRILQTQDEAISGLRSLDGGDREIAFDELEEASGRGCGSLEWWIAGGALAGLARNNPRLQTGEFSQCDCAWQFACKGKESELKGELPFFQAIRFTAGRDGAAEGAEQRGEQGSTGVVNDAPFMNTRIGKQREAPLAVPDGSDSEKRLLRLLHFLPRGRTRIECHGTFDEIERLVGEPGGCTGAIGGQEHLPPVVLGGVVDRHFQVEHPGSATEPDQTGDHEGHKVLGRRLSCFIESLRDLHRDRHPECHRFGPIVHHRSLDTRACRKQLLVVDGMGVEPPIGGNRHR